MAHMVDIRADCATCNGLASHEVFDSRHASVGTYCWKHAQEKQAALEAEEKAAVRHG